MIKYILTHPIQYQSPLIKYISKNFKIKVLYRSNISVSKFHDEGFSKKVKISNELVKGYNYEFLKHFGTNKITKLKPYTYEFKKKIFDKETKIIWLHGYKNWYNFILIILSFFFKKKVFVRDEFNLIKKRNSINLLKNKIYFKIIDKFIDAYLSIGKVNKRALISFGINKKKIFNVPYVVDNQYFFSKVKKEKNKIVILFSGKLIHRKGCDILLKAFEECNKISKFKKNVILNIIGDGKMVTYYKTFVKKKNLRNVFFKGFQSQQNIRGYYAKSKVLIVPSREENWGLVINEAMSAGNAIISSDVVGASLDLVKNNFNGFTFRSEDHIDLKNKILKLIKNKNNLNKFCKNSKKIMKNWSFNQCLEGLDKAISHVSKE